MIRLSIIIIITLCLSSCGGSTTKDAGTLAAEMDVDSLPSQCPYLTRDHKGNPVMSWVRMVNDSATAFCYAVADGNKGLGKTVVVPGTGNIKPHGENLPKLIFKPDGDIIVLWGEGNPNPVNKYSGLVYYVQSFDNGLNWTSPQSLVSDTAGFDQRYYDVAMMPDGEIAITWLDNRKKIKKEGSGLYFAKSRGRDGFNDERLISEPSCQCCRTDLFVDSKAGVHVLYRAIIDDSIRDMVHIVSTDSAKTFSMPARISNDNWVIHGCPHTGPAVTENASGLHYAWFTGGSNPGCYYTGSAIRPARFGMAERISREGSHPQLTTMPGGEIVIVWDENQKDAPVSSKKIGIQLRTSTGNEETTRFITPDATSAGYPVIIPLNDKEVMIAYTKMEGKKGSVKYQVVTVK